MENPNPLHYSDLIKPDNSITDLIAQLKELITQYDAAKSKIQTAAKEVAQSMQNVSAATDEQREQIQLSCQESEKLVKSYRDVTTNQWKATQAFVEAAKAEKDKTQIDKLVTQINTSLEGSYNRLSAQYRLNKIRLNEMSEAQRSGTEAGRKLEAETKAIYEQMNKLQLATGKAQLQVGHYERGLLSAVGVSDKMAESLLDTSKATENLKGVMAAAKSPIGAIAAVVGAGVAAFKLFKASVNSTQETGDRLALDMAEWEAGWERFKKSIATFDFTNFIQGMRESAAAGRDLAAALDEAFERENSIALQRSAVAAANEDLAETLRNTGLGYEERIEAGRKYLENIKSSYEQEIELAKNLRDKQLNYLFETTNQRTFASEKEKEAAKAEFAERIKVYNLNTELINQANEYNQALSDRDTLEGLIQKANVKTLAIYEKQLTATRALINAAEDDVKSWAAFLKQYNLSNDESVTAYVEAEKKVNAAQAAFKADNRRIINTINAAQAQQTKELGTQSKARAKAIEDERKEREATNKKIAEEEKKRIQDQINAKNALLQAELQTINLQIAVTKEGTDEMLKLRINAINKQREIELYQNTNKVEAIRQKESDINAKYDLMVERQSADFYGKRAERDLKASQDLAAAEFSLLNRNEIAKTRFRLEQERDRLKAVLELNKTAADKLTDTEVKAIETTIKAINKEIKGAAAGKLDLYDIFGFGKFLTGNQKSALDKTISATLGYVNEMISAWSQLAQARVDAAQASVDATKSELDAEIEARNNGYANNVATKQKELALEKKQLAEAQKEKAKAAKAQRIIDTTTQTASLITASANIWASLSGIPIIGPGLAIAALATMWASFAGAKIMAAKAAQSESYGDGTVELLEGGSHASGHDIDLGTTKRGKRRRAEGGEYFAIINKKNSRRYGSVIPDVINSFNDGTFAEKFQRADAVAGAFVGADVSKLEKDVSAIRSQGAESRYVDAKGNTVIRYKNLTKIIKS